MKSFATGIAHALTVALALAIAFTLLPGVSLASEKIQPGSKLLPDLASYVQEVAAELHLVPGGRKPVLDAIAIENKTRLDVGKPAYITFICTQISRRCHM
ncbi:MAG: hypothetical protein ACXW3Z_14200 [Limisphaerales bacterium]